MEHDKKGVSIPYSGLPIVNLLACVFLPVMAVLILLAEESRYPFLLRLVGALVLLGAAVILGIALLLRVHVDEKEISLVLLGQTMIRCKAEDIHLLCAVRWRDRLGRHRLQSKDALGISTLSGEQIAQRWVGSSDSLPINVRIPGGTGSPLEEYLVCHASRSKVFRPTGGVLWLEPTPDLIAALNQYYPHLPRETVGFEGEKVW